MANSVIQLKYSDVTGNTPSSLANGEIAINTYDGKFFYRGGPSNTIQSLTGFSGPAGLNQEVQFNDNGSLGANGNFTYDKISSTLIATNVAVTAIVTDYIEFGNGTRQYTANAGTGGTGGPSAAIDRQTYTAGASQSTFNINYTSPYVLVIVNGVTVDPSEYTATNNVSITLATSAQAGDIVDLVGFAGNVISSFVDQVSRDTANAAYIHANAAFEQANSGTGSTDQVARDTANAAFIEANTANIKATSAEIYANGSFNAANSAGVYANGAYAAANTADNKGTSGGIYANGAFNTANSAGVYANGAYLRANTANVKADSAAIYANGAFIAANTADVKATSAGIYANGAFTRANSVLGGFLANTVFVGNTNGFIANSTLSYFSSNNALVSPGDVAGSILRSTQSINDEGGQIELSLATTNQSLVGSIAIDIFQNKFRIFETGGSNRGVFIDMANTTSAGVGTDLLNPTATPDTVARNTSNSAFIQANSAFIAANSAGIYANGAFAAANAATATDTTQNNSIAAAFAAANSAVATNLTQNTSITAAFAAANSAGVYANGAFAAANSKLDLTGGTITGSLNVSGNIVVGTYVDMNVQPSNPPRVEGRLFYDRNQKALSYYNEQDMTLQIGQEHVVRVWNNSGQTILNGRAVYVTPGSSANGFPNVALASASSQVTSEVIGLATQNIPPTGYGYITSVGKVNDLDTSLFTEGQELYLSDTVPGTYTNTPPNPPSIPLNIGYTTVSDPTAGAIYVSIHLMEGVNKTNGAILFARNNVIDEDPLYLHWDFVNNRLGINTENPQANLHVAGDGLFTGNVTISGNLNISNAQSIVTQTLDVGGNLITFNSNTTGSPVSNAEIRVNRGNEANVFIRWDESINEWTMYEGGAFATGHIIHSEKTAKTWEEYSTFAVYEKQTHPIGADLANATNETARTADARSIVAENQAIAGFHQANASYDTANSASIYANGAFVSSNSAGIYANGAFITANSSGIYANGAFVAANNRALKVGDTFTGNVTIANGNVTIINTTTSVSNTTGALVVTGGVGVRGNVYADNIFDGGIEILLFANAAYNHANAAYLAANNAGGSGADQFARDQANAAFITANSAGIYANGAFVAANSSGVYANGAFVTANSAGIYANGAFIRANNSLNANTGGIVTGQLNVTSNIITTNLTLTANATSNLGALKLTGFPSDTNLNNGLLQIGEPLGFVDTNIIMSAVENVNSYAQFILQNKSSGTRSSSDYVVNNDRPGGTAIYGDFGINSSTFDGPSPFNLPDGTYLIGAGGSLTVGTLGAHDFRVATSETLRANINSTTGKMHVLNDAEVGGNFNVKGTSPGKMRTINFVIDGGGSVITTGPKGNVFVDFAGTIDGWTILGDVSGTITVDVSKSTYGTFPTFTGSGGTSPVLTAQQKNQNIGINWTGFTTISANDILRFAVSGTPSGVTLVTVALEITSTS